EVPRLTAHVDEEENQRRKGDEGQTDSPPDDEQRRPARRGQAGDPPEPPGEGPQVVAEPVAGPRAQLDRIRASRERGPLAPAGAPRLSRRARARWAPGWARR